MKELNLIFVIIAILDEIYGLYNIVINHILKVV